MTNSNLQLSEMPHNSLNCIPTSSYIAHPYMFSATMTGPETEKTDPYWSSPASLSFLEGILTFGIDLGRSAGFAASGSFWDSTWIGISGNGTEAASSISLIKDGGVDVGTDDGADGRDGCLLLAIRSRSDGRVFNWGLGLKPSINEELANSLVFWQDCRGGDNQRLVIERCKRLVLSSGMRGLSSPSILARPTRKGRNFTIVNDL
jgi:hypothetical protein